jgi:hypothetical protein
MAVSCVRQRMFKAFDHALVVSLTGRDTKTVRLKCNVGKGENTVVSRVKTQVIGDAVHCQVRLCERSTMLKRSAISFAELGSALYQPSCTNFSKLILVADQENFLALLQ